MNQVTVRAGRQAVADHEVDVQASREGLAAEIEATDAARDKELPPLWKRWERAKEKHAQLQRELDDARQKLRAAEFDCQRASTSFSERIQTIRTALLQTADPQIDVFVGELRELYEKVRRAVEIRESYGSTNPITGTRELLRQSNSAEIDQALQAIRRAQAEAEALKSDGRADVSARLAELRARVRGEVSAFRPAGAF